MIFRRQDVSTGRQTQLDLSPKTRPSCSGGAEADEAQTQAERDEAEELYGDYQLVVDAIGDRLLDVRETYAATLEDDAADDYRPPSTARPRNVSAALRRRRDQYLALGDVRRGGRHL